MFFFDLEAGGLLGTRSSILSAAYGTDKEAVTPLYAKPTAGTYLYRWSEENVWQPIKQQVAERRLKWRTEHQLLTDLIEQLKNQQVIAGWNIGYHAQPVKYQQELRGFDLPILATRAQKYGLLGDLQTALKGKTIRDIGQEYAALTARVVLQNKGRVDESIFKQAVGYQKVLSAYGIDVFSSDIQDIAYTASTKNIRLAGWKQETIYETLFHKQYQAHEAGADVRAGLHLVEELDKGKVEQQLADNLNFWNRRTVLNKLLSSARYGVGEGRQFETATAMWDKAADYKLSAEFQAGLESMSKSYGVHVDRLKAGMGVGVEQATQVAGTLFDRSQKIFSNLPSKAFNTLRANKGTALLLGAVGFLDIVEPGQWFSGKDDAYNTIPGLLEGGMAAQMRKSITDFGSGWVRRAISMGVSQTKIAEAARRLGKEVVSTGKESFVLGREMGQGGMGEVFSAQSLLTGRGAVYKRAKDDADLLASYTEPVELGVFSPRAANRLIDRWGMDLERKISLYKETLTPLTRQIRNFFAADRYSSPLHYEAAMQAAAHKSMPDLVPEVLGTTQHGYLQAFTGRAVRTNEASEAAEFINTTYREAMKSSTILHADPDITNIIRTFRGDYQITDWGVSAPRGTLLQSKELQKGYTSLIDEAVRSAQAKQPGIDIAKQSEVSIVSQAARPRALKEKQAVVHKEGVRLASGMAKNSGQRNKRSGSIASRGSMYR